MKFKKKVIYVLMIIFLFFQNMSNIVMAVTEISKADLKKGHSIKTNLQYKNEDGTWHDVICNYINYNSNGKQYPAYCIKHGVHGVDEEGPYTVEISDLLSDNKIWRTIINGYPYKTAEQLGVETNDDAYLATKQAIYSVMLNRNVKEFYKGKNEQGEEVVNAIYNISEIGKNGNQTIRNTNLNINKVGDLKKLDEEYYYQEFKVKADVDLGKFTVMEITGYPDKSFVADKSSKPKNKFEANETFRIMIPSNKINEDVNGKITIEGECKTYPIFFGKAPRSEIQDYAITYNVYQNFEATEEVCEKTNKSIIKLLKKDEETLKPIPGVKYSLKLNNKIIATKETDSKGEITFENLYPGAYKIEEISTDENYIISNEIIDINLKYRDEITKELTNKHKKGNLKITKVDKDDNSITLGAIKFNLLNENKEIVKELTTDADGQIYVENINTGNYTLQEIKTKKEYNLCIDENITVNWNKTTDIVIENEKKKGEIEVIKTDKDNNSIKLSGVEFKVCDNNNNIVDILKTNNEGYAKTKRLVAGEYYLQETKTNNKYVLDNKKIKVSVEDKDIKTLNITNEKKKGKILIQKTSNNDSPLFNIKKGDVIQGVTFEIFDSNKNLVDTVVTDEKGQAISRDLEIGRYMIKEKNSTKNYFLNSNEFFINIQDNKEIKVLKVENEPTIPKLKINKTGPEEAFENSEISYKFSISNTGNTDLSEFTWTEYLPYEQVEIKKMTTGSYNTNLDYKIYLKTSKKDYELFKQLNTQKSEYIDFSNAELEKNEEITQIKITFDKVQSNFTSVTGPEIYVKLKKNVKKDDIIENNTDLTGKYNDISLKDESKVKTVIKHKVIDKKLPRTGC